MTEEQAIERLTEAIYQAVIADEKWVCDDLAEAAWNEIKAIAREDAARCRRVPHLARALDQQIVESLRP